MSHADPIVELQEEIAALKQDVATLKRRLGAMEQKEIDAEVQSLHGVFKPSTRTDPLWPATRARNMVKAVNPDAERKTFDWNVRYLAERLHTSPVELLRTNPITVGRRLGITEVALTQMIGDYYSLRNSRQ